MSKHQRTQQYGHLIPDFCEYLSKILVILWYKRGKFKCLNDVSAPNLKKKKKSSNNPWWTSQSWRISPETRRISPWHLPRWLLFSSHTSLLVQNWWGHGGTSRNERRRVSETDLFPAFALRPCQLTQSEPLIVPAPHRRQTQCLGRARCAFGDGTGGRRSAAILWATDKVVSQISNKCDRLKVKSDNVWTTF